MQNIALTYSQTIHSCYTERITPTCSKISCLFTFAYIIKDLSFFKIQLKFSFLPEAFLTSCYPTFKIIPSSEPIDQVLPLPDIAKFYCVLYLHMPLTSKI